MATTPESKVKRVVDAMLKAYGAFNYTPTTAGYGRSGFFDRLVLLKGVPIGVELKATADDMPTRLQTQNALDWFESGGAVLCIHKDNIDELRAYLACANASGPHTTRVFIWPNKAMHDYQTAKKG